jgi:histidyl-tRNA synthetase
LYAQGPQRLYYIGPIFRYERPQAGRYRQSHQFGVECAGYAQPEADAEVIAIASDLLQEYRLSGVTLHVNSIGDDVCRPKYREALQAHFAAHRDALSEDSQRRLDRNPLRLLDSKAPEDQELIASAPHLETFLCPECRAHFSGVERALSAAGIPYTVDPRIVRGLDYYTRTVFEFTSGRLGAQNAICAGGRYDTLVASLGGPDVPAVGFALGLERFLWATEGEGSPEEARREGLQLIAIGAQAMEALLPLAAGLRHKNGGPVFIDYGDRKLLAQLKIADRNLARYALILGEKELAEQTVVLRDLVTRTDRTLPFGKDTLEALGEVRE